MFSRRFITFVLTTILCGARVASAQQTHTGTSVAPSQTVQTHVTVVLPSSLSIGGQYYDASVSGVEDFMSALRGEDPAAWAQLEADAEHLRLRRNWAWGTGVTGLVVGSFVGLAAPWIFASTTNEAGIEIHHPNWTLAYTGLGIMSVSAVAAMILMPRRGDLMEFVNKHNRLRPGTPLHLQLGLAATPDSVACAATVTF